MKLTKEDLDPRHRAFLCIRVDDAPEVLDGLAVAGDALLGLVGKGRVPLARVHDHGIASCGGGLKGDVVHPLEVVDELLEDLRAEGGGVLAEVEVLARQRRVVLKEVVPVQVIEGEDALGRVRGREHPEARDDAGQLGRKVEDLLQKGDEGGDRDISPVALDEVVVREGVHGWARGPELARLARLPFGKVKHGNGWTHEGQRSERPESHGSERERGYSGQEVPKTGAARRSTRVSFQAGDETSLNSRQSAITLYSWRRRWAEPCGPMTDSAEAYSPRIP